MKVEFTGGQRCVVLSVYTPDPRSTVRVMLLPDEAKSLMVQLAVVINQVEKDD